MGGASSFITLGVVMVVLEIGLLTARFYHTAIIESVGSLIVEIYIVASVHFQLLTVHGLFSV